MQTFWVKLQKNTIMIEMYLNNISVFNFRKVKIKNTQTGKFNF